MLGKVNTKRHLIRFVATLVNASLTLTLFRSCGYEFGSDGNPSSLEPDMHGCAGGNIRTRRFMAPHVQNGCVA